MNSQIKKILTITLLTTSFSVGFVGEVLAATTMSRFNESPTTETAFQETDSPSQGVTQLIARMRGRASWYGPRFHGRRTASGERFNAGAYTAAHRSLPFGTKVRVTNLRNGRAVVVRINDRGPYAGGRVIDLSKAAAQAIGMIRSGTAPVRIEILGR